MLAVWLEAKFSKKEILALYLNRVYFGAGAYGIEAAAQRYYNKPAQKLTVAEAATLAGLVITDLISDGLNISGIGTWIAATVIVEQLPKLFPHTDARSWFANQSASAVSA